MHTFKNKSSAVKYFCIDQDKNKRYQNFVILLDRRNTKKTCFPLSNKSPLNINRIFTNPWFAMECWEKFKVDKIFLNDKLIVAGKTSSG